METRSGLRLSACIFFRRHLNSGMIGVLAVALLARPTFGEVDHTWFFNGDGTWSDLSKWSNGVPNDAGARAIIDDGDVAATVTLDDSRTVNRVTLGTNDTLIIQSNSSAVTLTANNGDDNFSNAGTIRLTGTGAGGVAQLAVSNGTLTNAASGTIEFQAGPESRSLSANLVNNGTVLVNHDVTLNKFQGSVTNNGIFSVPSGNTLSVSNASTMDQNGGSLNLSGTLQSGTLTQNGGTLNFGGTGQFLNTNYKYLGGTISGTPILRGSTLTLGPGGGAASFFMDASNTLASDVRVGQTITLQSNDNSVTLTNGSGFTNNGTINLTGIGTAGGTRLSAGSTGMLTNSATGVINFQAGPESRFFDADLINNGTVSVNHDTNFDKFGGSYTNNNILTVAGGTTLSLNNANTLNQNGGTYTLNGTQQSGTFTQNGGTFNFGASALLQNLAYNYLGGTISGTPKLRNTTLTLGPGTAAASFFMDTNNTLASDVRVGQTITLQSDDNSVTLTNTSGFTNNGTINLTGIGTAGGTRLSTGSTGVLTNSATGVINFQAGLEAKSMSADLINNGTVSVNHDTNFDKFGGSYTNNNILTVVGGTTLSLNNANTLNQNGGTYTLSGTQQLGTFTQNGGTFVFGANALLQNLAYNYLGGAISGTPRERNTTLTLGPGTAAASFFMDANNTLASDVRVGQTITLQSNDNSVTLTNGSGFTNNGTINLTGIGTAGGTQLNAGSTGVVTNSATGVINFQAGPESRTFNGDLVNNGTINVNKDTGFNKSLNTVTNNGLLKVASSATLSITNGGTLTNNSGSTLTGGTYDIAGVFQYAGASVQTNQAGIILRGASAFLINSTSSGDALLNLATNSSSGALRVLNGRNFATTATTFANNGIVEFGGGTFSHIGPPTFVFFNNNAIGQLLGSGTIAVSEVINAGLISPGASPGILQFSGNFTQNSTGSLAIGINGNNNSDPQNPQYDVLKVAISANLGGSLALALDGAFTPSFSDVFTVLDAGVLNGTFSNVANGQRLSTTGNQGSFVVTYNGSGDVVLSNFALAGDYKANGIVDAGDYVLWRKTPASYGGAGGYATWRSNFGRTNLPGAGSGAGSVMSQTAVPEPSAMLLGLTALVFSTLQYSRRRRLSHDREN